MVLASASRRLSAALAGEEPGSVLVRWHAFQLQPDLPAEGVAADAYFAAKFGGEERVRSIHDRVTAVAQDVGLDLRFDRQERAPNTLLAHRAVKLVRDPEAAIETLFAAHFAAGEDIGDRETVLRLLPDVDPAALDRGDGARAVADDLEVAEQIGVTGVPFFVAGGRVARLRRPRARASAQGHRGRPRAGRGVATRRRRLGTPFGLRTGPGHAAALLPDSAPRTALVQRSTHSGSCVICAHVNRRTR